MNVKRVTAVLFALAAILLLAVVSFAAEAQKSSAMLQMDRIENIIYGEIRHGGLIDRLNSIEAAMFGRSLPGSIAERQTALLNFVEKTGDGQASLLFKLGVAEWAVSKTSRPDLPALGRIQKMEQELEGTIQEGKPIVMRTERLLSMLLSDPVRYVETVISSDMAVTARFMEEIGPGKSKKGDKVFITLTESYIYDGLLIAPAGSRVITTVSDVKKPGSFGVPGEVKIEFDYLEILGSEHPLVKIPDTDKDFKGAAGVAGAAGASMVGAMLLGPFGLVGGAFIRGNAINIPEGTTFQLQLSGKQAVSAYRIPVGLGGKAPEQQQQQDGSPDAGQPQLTGGSSGGDDIFLPKMDN